MAKTVSKADFDAQVERIDDLLKQIVTLKKKVKALEAQNAAHEEKITKVEEEQKQQPPPADPLWTTIAKKNVKKSKEQLKVINVMADESKERSKKEKNVIVFGLKESAKESIREKKDDDLEEINKILQVLSLQNEKVEGNFRLNAKDTTKPKPLVLVLKDRETRNRFLQAAKKLKGSHEHEAVFLGPDLTEAQRLQYKELVKIRDKKNEKMGEEEKKKKIWCIRDNVVVQLNRRN